ncbi:uncharacterized protein C17orf80 homolog isoform X2 [Arvicola amphibius]|uniref:uncharacterized protein C17orf80 homolog isoform X2 n=1 Tax=Arvicola amphibius TaxID=1047088 RepID=UPI0018E3C256|nr:uncharacterized protein C17orf80 homolog isoform X2 [Arvicola amphibius]
MAGAGPRMEVCPYCKKPFKRLKSHLPHCKMIGPPESADQKVYQSKPASLSHTKKEARPTKGLTQAKRREQETETEGAQRNAPSEKGSPEWTAATFPLTAGVLERAGTTETGGKTNDQNQPSFQVLSHAKIKVTLQRVKNPQSHASDATSPKRELAEDVTGSKGGPCHPSETEGLLVGSVEPVLSDQGRKYSSTQHHAKPATSASLKLDTVDPQRQKLLAKLLDAPVSDCHSPKNSNHGVHRGRPLILNKESSSRDGDHVSEVSPYPGNAETQKKSESLLDLHPAPLGETLVKELDLGTELCQRKGNPESSMSATEVQGQACSGRDNKNPILPAKAKTQATLALLNVLTPPEGTPRKLLSVPESGHQCLASPVVKSPPEVPAITPLVGSKKDVLEPVSFRQPHALQTGYLVSKCSLVSHVATADSEALSRSVGLEWFPELYPGYIGLGVLPRGPQHWNSVAQMPPPATSQGASVSKVPWLGRSSADSWSSEAPAHTTSSFPLMRLLGAMHKGWVRCNATIKKSSVGSLTMLFAGYFILCCNWSFKHLSKPSA